MKKLITIIIIISLPFFACSKSIKLGEKVYKEISVNGETFSKWMIAIEFSEYDSKGNKIHSKNSDGFEEKGRYEYDNKGNKIHYKSNYCDKWWEYDDKGKLIHYKTNGGEEEWYEYDSNGNKIHYKNSYVWRKVVEI